MITRAIIIKINNNNNNNNDKKIIMIYKCLSKLTLNTPACLLQ